MQFLLRISIIFFILLTITSYFSISFGDSRQSLLTHETPVLNNLFKINCSTAKEKIECEEKIVTRVSRVFFLINHEIMRRELSRQSHALARMVATVASIASAIPYRIYELRLNALLTDRPKDAAHLDYHFFDIFKHILVGQYSNRMALVYGFLEVLYTAIEIVTGTDIVKHATREADSGNLKTLAQISDDKWPKINVEWLENENNTLEIIRESVLQFIDIHLVKRKAEGNVEGHLQSIELYEMAIAAKNICKELNLYYAGRAKQMRNNACEVKKLTRDERPQTNPGQYMLKFHDAGCIKKDFTIDFMCICKSEDSKEKCLDLNVEPALNVGFFPGGRDEFYRWSSSIILGDYSTNNLTLRDKNGPKIIQTKKLMAGILETMKTISIRTDQEITLEVIAAESAKIQDEI